MAENNKNVLLELVMSTLNKVNAYQPFFPKDAFSKEMLSTIPRKVSRWLQNMEQEPVGSYGDLRWSFDVDGGTILYGDFDKEESIFIQLWWTSTSPGAFEEVCGTDERFENIGTNLEFFTLIEQVIYQELNRLQEQYARTPRVQSRHSPNETPLNEAEPIILNAAEREWSRNQEHG